jgi:hypothetical protein
MTDINTLRDQLEDVTLERNQLLRQVEQLTRPIEFNDWLQLGMDRKWALPVVCGTHDGLPTSPIESEEIDKGHDPCIPVVRVCHDDEWQNIYNNTISMQWRDK